MEAEESPTLVLDRADATAPSLHQPIVSPDPFRDVIKTEPAPDLPSLIEDMIPYLVEHGITTPGTTTLKPLQSQAANHQQHPTNFDYMDKLALIRPPYRPEEGVDSLVTKNKFTVNQDGQLKEGVLSSYKSKEDQIVEHVSESVHQVPGFDYERISSPLTDHTIATKRYEDHHISSNNITESTFTKLNGSKSNDSVASSRPDFKDSLSMINETKVRSTTLKSSEDSEDPIFSLDSVLDLLFSSNTGNNSPVSERTTESSTTSRSTTKSSIEPAKSTEQPVTEATTVSKVLENEIPVPVASLLKLAGCNIYGRMYRVGRIITELSGPCLECRCTEIGVQCKQLQC